MTEHPPEMPRADDPPPDGEVALAPDVLGQLQVALIDAVQSGVPLAGHSRALSMPDMARLAAQSDVILSSDNLGGPIRLKHAGATPLRILSQQAIRERAGHAGELHYLRFEPAQRVPDGVRLTLRLESAHAERGVLPDLGMSALQVIFQHTDDGWRALEDTAAMSA